MMHCPFKISFTLFLKENLTIKEPTYYILIHNGKLEKNKTTFLGKTIQIHDIIVVSPVKTSLTLIDEIEHYFLTVATAPNISFHFNI